MTALAWDKTGERFYQTGIDRGVLYMPNNVGVYDDGVAWNGLTTVTESPSGAEATAQYADNIKYLNLFSAEEFSFTIEAFTYPPEFGQYDGTATPTPGVGIGQQRRPVFGFSYRTRLGNDLEAEDFGYQIHLVYGCQASPSERGFATINDSPEAINFSWDVNTTPVPVTGLKPTSLVVIDSTKVSPTQLAAFELVLYGSVGVDPFLPLPDAVITAFTGGLVEATPTEPTFVAGTGVITIPSVTGVQYFRGDTDVLVPPGAMASIGAGNTLIIYAQPADGYVFPAGVDNDWMFEAD